ncbi:MAG: hypothetical protein ACI3YM_02080 [Prevotella sp.]
MSTIRVKTTATALSVAMGMMLSFASCSSDADSAYNESAVKENQFQNSFVQTFGKIAANIDWGFGNKCVPDASPSLGTSTRSARPDYLNNLDKYGIPAPAKVTQREQEVVKQWFEDHKNPVSVDFDARNFFVQQLYLGTQVSRFSNLYAGYGYNKNAKKGKQNDKITPFILDEFGYTQIMINSGTEQFSFDSKGKKNCSNYSIQAVMVDGVLGYYVGFDYEDSETAPDGIYTDLILKISRAESLDTPIPSTGRVIVEDLGSIGDFDYNDAVFDAYVYYGRDGGTYADIVVRAAGGVKNIYVAGHEIHEVLGIEAGKMANTREGTLDVMPARFTVKVSDKQPSTFDFNTIEVRTDETVLTAKIGKAPEKICVETDYDWCDEKQNIVDKYPKFKQYVSQEVKTGWWR